MDGSDRGWAEKVGPGADMLQTLLKVGCRLVGQEWLHDDGCGDGVGEGLEEAEPEPCEEFLLPAQQDAHAGLRVVLEVQQLPELDEDVVGQELGLVDDEDGMDLARAVELEHIGRGLGQGRHRPGLSELPALSLNLRSAAKVSTGKDSDASGLGEDSCSRSEDNALQARDADSQSRDADSQSGDAGSPREDADSQREDADSQREDADSQREGADSQREGADSRSATCQCKSPPPAFGPL